MIDTERINQKVRSKQISWNVIDARFLWKRRSFVRNFRFLFHLLDRIEFTFHDIPIFLPFYAYVTKFTRKIIYNKIVEIFVHAISRSPSIPRFFFLEKLSRELSICLRRIFANLRSVLIRGNRLPVKVISSDDGKTDFSSNWHHSRRGGTLAFDRRRIGMQPAQPVLPVAAYAASAAKDASVLLSGDPWHKHTLRHEIWRREALLRSKIVSTRHSRLRRFNETRTCALGASQASCTPLSPFLPFREERPSPLFLLSLSYLFSWCNPAHRCFFIFE